MNKRKSTARVRGGRQIIGSIPNAPSLSGLHPIAEQAMLEELHRTTAKPKTRRRVVVVKDGMRIPIQTVKTDEELITNFQNLPPLSTPSSPHPPPPSTDPSAPTPFDALVAAAVREQLLRMGLGNSSPSPTHTSPLPPANANANAPAFPAAWRTNRHMRASEAFEPDDPCNTQAMLSDRIQRYMKWIEHKKLSYSYVMEHGSAFRILVDVIGDKPVGGIGLDDADAFVDALGKLPMHWSKKPEYRDLRVPDIIVKASRLSAKNLMLPSQQRLVDVVRTFFVWMENRKEIRPGLLLGVRLFQAGRDMGGQRDWLAPDELTIIFSPKKEADFHTPWKTWTLRLALFSGMRQREIAQLYVDDVIDVDGIPSINITCDREGQRIKNKSSRRVIPIHRRLIDAGFLDYVEQARTAGVHRLFPDLPLNTSGSAKRVTNWFSTYIRKDCGIINREKTFHSIRHSFATFAERSGLRDEHILSLLGHSWGSNSLRSRYAKELDVSEKHKRLHLIEFPDIPMEPHRPERYTRYFRVAYADQTRKARLDRAYGRFPIATPSTKPH